MVLTALHLSVTGFFVAYCAQSSAALLTSSEARECACIRSRISKPVWDSSQQPREGLSYDLNYIGSSMAECCDQAMLQRRTLDHSQHWRGVVYLHLCTSRSFPKGMLTPLG